MKTPYEIKEGRSDEYIGTVNHKSRTGKLIIEALRREHKRRAKLDGKRYRVVLKGRLGENNENAFKYAKSGQMHKHCWVRHMFGAHSHQNIKLDDAAYADMYVYERY